MPAPEVNEICDRIWVRALKSEEKQIEIEMPNAKSAKKLRMDMYNCARRARAPQEVREAKEKCILQLDGNFLIVNRMDKEAYFRGIMIAAGMKEQAQKQLSADQLAEESLKRFMEAQNQQNSDDDPAGKKFGIRIIEKKP
jgi:hypothetical protein